MIVHRRWVLAGCALALSAAGCVGPSRSDEDFARKAGNSAEAMRGAVETGRLVADLVLRGRSFGPYVNVAATNAEAEANGVIAAFGSVQPPSAAADAMRERFDEVLQAAAGALADLRISVRRGELSGVREAAAELAEVSADLEPLVGV